MSSLLEQAIIDAAALKEAAIKNAEAAILNKYSADIKEVVENLFEQEDEEPTEAPEQNDESDALEDSIPNAFDDEIADDDSEIVLNMEDLKDMANALSSAEEDLVGDPAPHESLMDTLPSEPPSLGSEMEVPTADIQATLEEEIEISDVEELLEELVVDIEPQKSGWAGTPEDIMKYKEELRLAQLSATAAEEQNKELVAARDRLSEQNSKMKNIISVLKEQVEKASLSNARLLYTNEVLTDNSLNERQRNTVVEALSNADSINEAKVIFETLKNAVGSVKGKAQPKSLRETIERPTNTLPRREARTDIPQFSSRMQILAGIKENK
tara:strand:- start:987 stop:1964 length:978 start_codon:yes stop_codon:yes gene_type:complete